MSVLPGGFDLSDEITRCTNVVPFTISSPAGTKTTIAAFLRAMAHRVILNIGSNVVDSICSTNFTSTFILFPLNELSSLLLIQLCLVPC